MGELLKAPRVITMHQLPRKANLGTIHLDRLKCQARARRANLFRRGNGKASKWTSTIIIMIPRRLNKIIITISNSFLIQTTPWIKTRLNAVSKWRSKMHLIRTIIWSSTVSGFFCIVARDLPCPFQKLCSINWSITFVFALVTSLERFVVKIGHNLSDVNPNGNENGKEDDFDNDGSFGRRKEYNYAENHLGHPDDAIIHEVQPLVNA